MRVIKTSDLRRLDVISVEEGRYLGSVCDVDLDPDTGRINALIVDEARPLRFLWGPRHTDVEIPWRDIVVVGADVVLVKNRTWKR
ncbi:MAG TPA: YlmC/YmxH family sporulation protein [Limnochordia bacterium]|nr:YlmC/YmxH family sporulation protein [Limnochordia bacterium]